MNLISEEISLYDGSIFFDKALRYGVKNGIIDLEKMSAILADGAKGIVQIAHYFGSEYLRKDIEMAMFRMVNLMSIYLEKMSKGDVEMAARSLADNTLLSHSRGGSDLLKQLFALPEDTIIGAEKSVSLKKFQARWTAEPMEQYTKELKKRLHFKVEIDAALWLLEKIGVANVPLKNEVAELVIRTALLILLINEKITELPDVTQFVKLIETLRKKIDINNVSKVEVLVLQDAPDQYRAVLQDIWKKIEKNDIPEILSKACPLATLLDKLQKKYYLRIDDLDGLRQYDKIVSCDWEKLTQGKYDTYSLLALFLCVACSAPTQRPVLSDKSAKQIIRLARKNGFSSTLVTQFIKKNAPFTMQEDLIVLWEDFIDQAEKYLLDLADASLEQALSFLKDHVNVVRRLR